MSATDEQKAMRYAGRVACIYDWAVLGATDRTLEALSKEECIKAIRKLFVFSKSIDNRKYPDMERKARLSRNLWTQVGKTYPGITNERIEETQWDSEEVMKAYEYIAREIRASEILRRLMDETGLPYIEIAARVGIKRWTLVHWIDFQEEISQKFVKVILDDFEVRGIPYTVFDVFDRVTEVYGDKNKIKTEGV